MVTISMSSGITTRLLALSPCGVVVDGGGVASASAAPAVAVAVVEVPNMVLTAVEKGVPNPDNAERFCVLFALAALLLVLSLLLVVLVAVVVAVVVCSVGCALELVGKGVAGSL